MSGVLKVDMPTRRWPRSIAGCGMLVSVAWAAQLGIAVTAEPDQPVCSGLCSPVEPMQLDRYRAQGLDVSAKSMTLSVILWDEYRRTRQPSDTGEASAMSAGVTLAHINVGTGSNSGWRAG